MASIRDRSPAIGLEKSTAIRAAGKWVRCILAASRSASPWRAVMTSKRDFGVAGARGGDGCAGPGGFEALAPVRAFVFRFLGLLFQFRLAIVNVSECLLGSDLHPLGGFQVHNHAGFARWDFDFSFDERNQALLNDR